jgi:hypothetical protein
MRLRHAVIVSALAVACSSPSPGGQVDGGVGAFGDGASTELDASPTGDAGLDGAGFTPEASSDASADSSVQDGGGEDASVLQVDAASAPQDASASGTDAALDGPVNGAEAGGPLALAGAVQKGPLAMGSTVQISTIDGQGSPTGLEFTTETTDDLGHFSITIPYRGYASLQASGFYFDELTGSLSAEPITMHALYDVQVDGSQTVNVNIITELAYARAVTLMSSGNTLEAAEAQAESELITALGVDADTLVLDGPGSQLDEIGANDATNAYVLAVSAILLEAVTEKGGTGALDAQLQSFLATVASDLAPAGTLPSSVQTEILAAEEAVDVDLTLDFFTLWLQAIDPSLSPANINLAIDTDGDGYANASDTCPLIANPIQSTIPPNVLCSVTRRTTFSPLGADMAGHFIGDGPVGLLAVGYVGTSDTLQFAILPGDGQGRFGAPIPVPVPMGTEDGSTIPSASSFIRLQRLAVDINGDGNVDLVSQVGYLPGDGTGHFGDPVYFPDELFYSGGEGDPIAVGDVNGDGILDVVGTDYDTTGTFGIIALLGTSPGVFGTLVTTPTANVAGVSPFVVDLNGDHIPDIIAGQEIWFGDGTGHFAEQGGDLPPGIPTGFGAGWVADFDGDGNLDLASPVANDPNNAFATGIAIAFGDGAGDFSTIVTTYDSLVTDVQGPETTVGDFNGDGKTDVWFYNAGAISNCTASLQVMLSEGRSFGPPQPLPITQGGCNGGSALVVDLNGDGISDVVTSTSLPDGGAMLQGYVIGCGGRACP